MMIAPVIGKIIPVLVAGWFVMTTPGIVEQVKQIAPTANIEQSAAPLAPAAAGSCDCLFYIICSTLFLWIMIELK